MDFPGIWVQPLMLSTMGKWGTLEPAMSMLNGQAVPSVGAFGAATGDVALAPFTIPGPCLVQSMWWYNGTSGIGGNMDAGIYTVNTGGTTITRLCSTGAVVQAGTATLQSANVTTAIRLEPGTYYMAISAVSGNVYGRAVPTVVANAQYGFGWQTAATSAGSGTLAATLTAATWTGLRYPVFGFSRLPSGQY